MRSSFPTQGARLPERQGGSRRAQPAKLDDLSPSRLWLLLPGEKEEADFLGASTDSGGIMAFGKSQKDPFGTAVGHIIGKRGCLPGARLASPVRIGAGGARGLFSSWV